MDKPTCGAYIAGTNNICHCMWSQQEATKSSTWRELKAIHFALMSFKSLVKDKSVKWHSDNQAAVRIVDIGSPNEELHDIWGPHTIDRFSNSINYHISRFNSRFHLLGSEAVDAFSVPWVGENNWLVPPAEGLTGRHCYCRRWPP